MDKENKEFEKKIIEFNILDARIRELEQNIVLLEKQITEIQNCQLSLDELKNTKEGTETFSSISPGILVKSKLLDNSEVMMDVGAKIFCKKSVDGAKEIIQKRLDQALEIHKKLSEEITLLLQEITKLEKEIREKQLKSIS
ncbi:MAG: prefoldin subunit alpha [Candidatus Pacearchaeota archaeon]|nr:MAG: prefoldin subunit alpha [Candidatus Pacearchaeota archaeon]